ncbi:poly(A) polymerase [Haliangium ochraceum DSM 14365]|uniref:Poly(A) polymerase I n=2 Tax=Haliangium ochraceum TaxID=80816 RepID=D0LK17_HALO1|nr:poly(A) polymerase [Haliangium ochraceum DSM 14365]
MLPLARRDNGCNAMRLDPARIDADADRVVRRLTRHGHKAYLVGGCVRDLLLDRNPKDFDVATSATPNQIRDIFRNCRIIGRRFRLAHVFFGDKIIETSTFRASPKHDDEGELLIRHDNVFGSATEDARRRDFTINGLFYDVRAEEVIDYVGGADDLDSRLVRTIGDPDIRFREDPVRMLRAIKFAARLGFDIEEQTYEALVRHRDEIRKCSPVRVGEEVYRLLRGGAARRSMELLHETGIDVVLSGRLAALFAGEPSEAPQRRAAGDGDGEPNELGDEPGDEFDNEFGDEFDDEPMDEEEAGWYATWQPQAPLRLGFLPNQEQVAERREHCWRMLDLLDEQVAQGESLSNSLLMAALLSPFVFDELMQPGMRPNDAGAVIEELAHPLFQELHVARRDSERTHQILQAQRRITPERRRRGKPGAMVRRDYFGDALTLYELTRQAQEREVGDLSYWHELRKSEVPEERSEPRQRRRRRGGRRRRRFGDDDYQPSANR